MSVKKRSSQLVASRPHTLYRRNSMFFPTEGGEMSKMNRVWRSQTLIPVTIFARGMQSTTMYFRCWFNRPSRAEVNLCNDHSKSAFAGLREGPRGEASLMVESRRSWAFLKTSAPVNGLSGNSDSCPIPCDPTSESSLKPDGETYTHFGLLRMPDGRIMRVPLIINGLSNL